MLDLTSIVFLVSENTNAGRVEASDFKGNLDGDTELVHSINIRGGRG